MSEQPGLLVPPAVPRLTTAGLAPTLWRRQAVVAAVNTGPPPTLTLTMDGVTVGPARFLASYHPVVGDSVWCLKDGTDLLVLGSLYADELTAAPQVRVGTTVITTSSGAVTTTETVVMTVVAPVVVGRIYKITADVGFSVSVTTDGLIARIREDTVAGTEKQGRRVQAPSTLSPWGAHLEAEYTADATEDKTFVLTFVRTAGTGTITLAASATSPSYLYVDQVR